MMESVSTAIKSANALVQLYEDTLKAQQQTPLAVADTQLTSLASYTNNLNPHLSAVLNDSNTIVTDKQSIVEKQQSLDQTKAGADPLDIRSSQLSVTKAQNSLADAQATLAKYYVRAPFAGTIASVPANAYAQAGSGTTLATLITAQQYVDLSVNEVDAAKIALGDKATITFDAIPDLTLTGSVAEIDQAGTVSQGVVTYNIKIGFDTQDPRVKSGMTANTNIITATAVDVLAVPSSAVKTQGGQSYVSVFEPPFSQSEVAAAGAQGVVTTRAPSPVPVTTGLSDTNSTEILSGLSAGQQIVVRTSTGTATAATAATTRTGLGGGGGGAIRIP